MSAQTTQCGFAAVIGLPNAGKSTLVNALVGSKVSIVTHKKQTTRQRVLGILTFDHTQMILIDTPGVFMPKKTLEKTMVKAAWDAIPDADVIMHIIDASNPESANANAFITKRLKEGKQAVLVLNKVDKVKKEKLLELTAKLNEGGAYEATYMISALKESGLKDLVKGVSAFLPEAPWMYEEDEITDMPMRLMAAEITREKIFEQLHKELPYSIAVETETWEPFDNGSVKISQIVYVERDSQKGIVLGKRGSQIKKIGEYARKELETLFDMRIHLKIFVKVKSGAIGQLMQSTEYGI
ncbi:MAG: GTPase Era [Pseudomonadota bacterium]